MYLINLCTISSIGRIHGRPKTNSKSHIKSMFFCNKLAFKHIHVHFDNKWFILPWHTLQRAEHGYLVGFDVVQQLQALCLQCFSKVHKFQNLLGIVWKKKHTKIITYFRHVQLGKTCSKPKQLGWFNVWQCTPSRYGANYSQVCVITLVWMPWNTKSPSHLRQIHLKAMLLLDRPL